MVTLSEWEAEIAQLREDLGSLEPMRMRWRFKPRLGSGASVAQVLLGSGGEQRLILSLFPRGASPGSRAQAEVEVVPDRQIEASAQGSEVLVAGIVEPGHAVVVLAGGHEFWPAYPATLGARAARL